MMTPLVAAFVLGLVSSGHCAVMCGPLMVAWRQPWQSAGSTGRLAVYHASRIAVYATGGFLAGLVGETFAAGGFARTLSIVAGVVLVAMAVARSGIGLPWTRPSGATHFWIGPVLGRVRVAAARHPMGAAVTAGALNALLPCGLLYAAVAVALTLAHPAHAAFAMTAFGLGTTPALVAVWWSAGAMARVGRGRLALLSPLILVLTGALLIARGLGEPRQHAHEQVPIVAPHHGAATAGTGR